MCVFMTGQLDHTVSVHIYSCGFVFACVGAKCKCWNLCASACRVWLVSPRTCGCFDSVWVHVHMCVCVSHSPTYKHTHIASSFWSRINMLWQFCVTLWILDLKCVGEADGLILRDYGHQATSLAAKPHRKNLFRLCVYVRGRAREERVFSEPPPLISFSLSSSLTRGGNLWGACERRFGSYGDMQRDAYGRNSS